MKKFGMTAIFVVLSMVGVMIGSMASAQTINAPSVGAGGTCMSGTPGCVARQPKFRVSTGGSSGNYFKLGNTFQTTYMGVVSATVMESSGGMDNLRKVDAEQADGGWAQMDQWVLVNRSGVGDNLMKFADGGHEYVHVVCNAKWADTNGVSDLADMEGMNVNLVMLSGGSASTWENLVFEDNGYDSITAVNDPLMHGEYGLLQIANNDSTPCGFYVASVGSDLMKTASTQFGKRLKLIEVDDDGDFNDAEAPDGTRLYEDAGFDDEDAYGNSGMTVFGDYDTIRVKTVFVVSKSWTSKNRKSFLSMINKVGSFEADVAKFLAAKKG